DHGIRQRGGHAVVSDPLAAFGSHRGAAYGGAGKRLGELASGGLSQGGRHLVYEALDGRRVVRHEDEGADAILDDEREKLVHPLLARPVKEAAAGGRETPRDVEEPANLARVAAGLKRRLV